MADYRFKDGKVFEVKKRETKTAKSIPELGKLITDNPGCDVDYETGTVSIYQEKLVNPELVEFIKTQLATGEATSSRTPNAYDSTMPDKTLYAKLRTKLTNKSACREANSRGWHKNKKQYPKIDKYKGRWAAIENPLDDKPKGARAHTKKN